MTLQYFVAYFSFSPNEKRIAKIRRQKNAFMCLIWYDFFFVFGGAIRADLLPPYAAFFPLNCKCKRLSYK
jgi:hypothetical protein